MDLYKKFFNEMLIHLAYQTRTLAKLVKNEDDFHSTVGLPTDTKPIDDLTYAIRVHISVIHETLLSALSKSAPQSESAYEIQPEFTDPSVPMGLTAAQDLVKNLLNAFSVRVRSHNQALEAIKATLTRRKPIEGSSHPPGS